MKITLETGGPAPWKGSVAVALVLLAVLFAAWATVITNGLALAILIVLACVGGIAFAFTYVILLPILGKVYRMFAMTPEEREAHADEHLWTFGGWDGWRG